MAEINYAEDKRGVQKKAADILIDEIRKLRLQQDRILIAVPGGRNVAALFDHMKHADIDWSAIHFFMVDERMVPIADPESNFSILWDHLGKELTDKGVLPADNIHPFRCEGKSAKQAIDDYEEELKRYGDAFDIVILSSGEDGHIGGLYPDHHSIEDTSQYFISMTDSPKPPSERMSASRQLVERAQVAIALFVGEAKRKAFERFQKGEHFTGLPVSLVSRVEQAFVITDLSGGTGEPVFICGDIGGTNANLSIVSEDMRVLDISRASTPDIKDFTGHVVAYKNAMEEKGYRINRACLSIAGPLDHTRRRAPMTNVDLVIDASDIEQKAKLMEVRLINDFQAIAFATNVAGGDDIRMLKEGNPYGDVRAVIGAGTGLGESIMYRDASGAFVPLHSEGGHVEACATDDEEMRLLQYMKEAYGRQHVLEYEDVVSGKGLSLIYRYVSGGNEATAEEVSTCADEESKKAFALFVRFYARKAKALCLECYATGGLYIAGGIAAKNIDKMDGFIDEFTKHDRFSGFLGEIPVIVLMDYDISHVGAAYALRHGG